MNFKPRREISLEKIEKLSAKTGYDADFCRLLLSRGIQTERDAEAFLSPSLDNLCPAEDIAGMREAADRISAALENGEVIVVYGDYDCDGLAGVAILYDFLKSRGAEVYYYIPDRAEEGYGLNEAALGAIAEEFLPDLLITVDCGITSVNEIAFARNELGIDVIVTDHHEVGGQLPDCVIIDQKISKSGFFEMCGAGVAFRLVQALGADISRYIEAAAVATVADCVPLTGDNRAIVSAGLKSLAKPVSKGLGLMIKSLALKRSPDAYDAAFKIAPRINAAGRLGSAGEVVELFCGDDYFELETLVEKLENLNAQRQAMCDAVFKDCLALLSDYALSDKKIIILKKDDWDAGVLGIVCSRLAEKFKRPAILLTKDKNGLLKGSGRSIEGINIFELVGARKQSLAKFGGHGMACGLSMEEDAFEGFVRDLADDAAHLDDKLFLPDFVYDIMTNAPPSLEFVEKTQLLAPFGVGNPQISYVLDLKKCAFSRIGDKEHLKYRLKNGTELVYFNGADKRSLLNCDTPKKLTVKFSAAEYANIRYAQGVVGTVVADGDIDIDGQRFDAHYIRQLFYSGDTITVLKELDLNQLLGFFRESIYGTCAVCYNKNSRNKLREILLAEGIDAQYALGGDIDNPLNTVALDLDETIDLSYFKRVVFLDRPLENAYCDYLITARDCKFYVCGQGEKIAEKCPEYADLARVFAVLKRVMSVKFRTVDEIFDALKGENVGYFEFYAAFCVFFDLKIIKRASDGFFIDNTVKSKLDASAFYGKLKGLLK